MANDKNKDTGGIDLGELGMIRNILMGQQVNEFEARFAQIEGAIADNNSSLEMQLRELEKSTNSSREAMHKTLSSQLEKLEKNMEKRLDQLENKLIDSSQRDRHKMGKLLSDMGKKLLDS